MIKEFIERYNKNESKIKEYFLRTHPTAYRDVVKNVIENISDGYGSPDPERIHEINDGDYQGTLVFVIAAQGYQPYKYWYVKVDYGSCSGCDTLEAITGYSNEKPTEEQVKDYMTLSLHILQGLKEMGDSDE